MFLGMVIDRANAAGPADLWAKEGGFLLGVALFMILLRPAVAGLAAAFQSVVLNPNLNVMVLSRLHRWTLGPGRHLL